MKKITNIMCGIILGVAIFCFAGCGTDIENSTDNEISTSDVTESTTEIETTTFETMTETITSTTDLSTTTTVSETTTTVVVKSNKKATSQEVPLAFNAESDSEQNNTCEYYEEVGTVETTPEYVVYKASTHYVHKNTCRWVDATCNEITDTSNVEARRCTECNPDIVIVNEYVPQQTSTTVGSMSYVKNFSRGTYYAYGGARYGGSGRNLIDCSCGDGTVKGSIASSYLYNNYGYNYNGKRTMVYLEISGYPSMNGYYYLDDSDAGNSNVIDFFYLSNGNCQFQYQGVVSVDCYIVNY